MSGKKAKEKKREEKEAEEQAVKPIGQVTIDVFSNLDVNVSNFPSDHNIALMVMCNALMKVSTYFIQHVNSKSNILLARPGASQADIIKMAAGN